MHPLCSRIWLLVLAALSAPPTFASAGWIGNNANPSNIYDINISTGAATNARSTGLTSTLSGITYDPTSGNVYGLTALDGATPNSLVRINPVTGTATLVGSTGLQRLFEGDLAFSPITGVLYGIDQNPDSNNFQLNLFQINPTTGHGTVIGPVNSTTEEFDFSALAFDSAGTLYTIEDAAVSANSVLYTLNPATGARLTSVPLNVNFGTTAALAFDPVTGTAYIADGGSGSTNKLYTLNTTTGVATMIGPLGDAQGLAGLTFVPQVPEPSSFALITVAVSGLALLRRLKCRS